MSRIVRPTRCRTRAQNPSARRDDRPVAPQQITHRIRALEQQMHICVIAVAPVQVGGNGRLENAQRLPIEVVNDHRQRQQRDHQPAIRSERSLWFELSHGRSNLRWRKGGLSIGRACISKRSRAVVSALRVTSAFGDILKIRDHFAFQLERHRIAATVQ